MIWPVKKLGEVIEFLPKSSRKAGDGLEEGLFQFFSSSQIQDKFINKADYKDEAIILGTGGSPSIHIAKNFSTSADTFVIKGNNNLTNKFLYYFLISKIEILEKGFRGAALKHLSKEYLKLIEIPLPSIEEQKRIVVRIEELFAKIDEAQKLREESKKATSALLQSALNKIFSGLKSKKSGEKKLGDIFIFNYGKGLSKFERFESGKFIVYGANGELGRSNKYLIEGESIIIGRKGSAGEVMRASGRYWPTDVTYFVEEDSKYNIDFAYYLFKYLNFPQYAKGVKPGINRNEIYNLKINLPPVKEQKKIVVYLDLLSEKVRKLQDLQQKSAENFKNLKKSILSQAFSGKLIK